MSALWTLDEIVAATGGSLGGAAAPVPARGTPPNPRSFDDKKGAGLGGSPSQMGVGDSPPAQAVTGISIDTRTLQPGDLFVALADTRDGHEFVAAAFKKGAAAALVRHDWQRGTPACGPLVRVENPLKALEMLAVAARKRLSPDARVIAVTGSAGKTTTKEMLRAGFGAIGRVHASEKSYNNHWGVPLTLARMPADTDFAVLEIGMNHAGEITPLSMMARPHVAIITTVALAHLGAFNSIEEIADAKAEIFEGMNSQGTAVLPGNNKYYKNLERAARAHGVNVVTFGFGSDFDAKVRTNTDFGRDPFQKADILVALKSFGELRFEIGLHGVHNADNAAAAVLAVQAVGGDIKKAVGAWACFEAVPGRGGRTVLSLPGGKALLIDESYNANPYAMGRVIETARDALGFDYNRLILVLGDMLELGPRSAELHRGLKPAIDGAGASLVFACGPMMKYLYDELPPERKGAWEATSAELEPHVIAAIQPGDIVMVKGSNGMKMVRIVEALRRKA